MGVFFLTRIAGLFWIIASELSETKENTYGMSLLLDPAVTEGAERVLVIEFVLNQLHSLHYYLPLYSRAKFNINLFVPCDAYSWVSVAFPVQDAGGRSFLQSCFVSRAMTPHSALILKPSA
jgi:hypothetical protein